MDFFFLLPNLTFFFQKKQREFEEYIRDKYITAKADFRTLLKETKFITYRCVPWNVSCQQFLSLLVLTRMAKAYFAFTHMLTLLASKDKKKPSFIKDQRQPTHLYLTFFLKERAQMPILILCYPPIQFFKQTSVFASLFFRSAPTVNNPSLSVVFTSSEDYSVLLNHSEACNHPSSVKKIFFLRGKQFAG